MSLFGAMFSGVSGLVAQSSAMGAVSDNITNVSTIGYKNNQVNFQTLVTKQVTSTFFSAGGVQSLPRQRTEVQGLLQSSTSQTDIAMSGQGFYVVNEAAVPGISNEYLFTRAGSFTMDNEGYLKNAQGYYLQGWKTDANGVVTSTDPDNIPIANQNIISTDFLETINLSRVGGTAASTTTLAVGANLPANADPYDANEASTQAGYQKTDVQFFDTLGNASNFSLVYKRSPRDNVWDLEIDPPTGTSVLTLYDSTPNTPKVYDSRGQLEFTERPADGSTVVIDGITYEFDSKTFASVTATAGNSFTVNGTGSTLTAVDNNTFSGLEAGDVVTINSLPGSPYTATIQSVGANGQSLTFTTNALAADAGVTDADAQVVFFHAGAGETSTYRRVDISTNTTTANDVSSLLSTIRSSDNDFNTTNNRVIISPSSSTALLFKDDGTGSISINPVGLLNSNGEPVTNQTAAFTVLKQDETYTDYTQFTFSGLPTDGETMEINGITYTFDSTETAGDDDTTIINTTLAAMLQDLESAIEANDPEMTGNRVYTRTNGSSTSDDTLVLGSLPSGSFDVTFSTGFGTDVKSADGNTTYVVAASTSDSTQAVNTKYAINFDADGLPSEFNVADIRIQGFSSGAADMDDDPSHAPQIALDLGTVGEADGMTQFGASFTPVFIQQNGSRFGTFAGVTISPEGLVTALFDNGETRTIYKLPIATFTNPNGLESRTGNVWNASEASGDYTLREADNGPAGQVVQGALEASTVDIGEEFTNMIVVQRAYSAATKIIRTADEMLEELTRIK